MNISIITINYNNQQGLERTLLSVVKQTYLNIEYIIVDGGSTDGSLAIIKQYENRINYWISEKDNGVYDAMNKGILKASGDYYVMLNSGDYLISETIISDLVKEISDENIIYCDLIWDDKGKKIHQTFPRDLKYSFLRKNSLGHQASLIHKSVHQKIGLYNTNYKIVSDWILYLNAICKYNLTHKYISTPMSICDRDGISCKPENWERILNERQHFLTTEFSLFESDYLLFEEKIVNLQINFFGKILKRLKII